MKPISTAQAIGAFIASRKAKKCQEATITWYEYMLGRLTAAHKDLPEDVFALDQLLAGINGSKATIIGHRKALRVFYNWLHRQTRFPNAAANLEPVTNTRRRPKTITEAQIDRLLAANQSHPRDYTMLCTLLDNGMRVGELLSMTRSSILIDDESAQVRVNGKTGEREVPLSPETLALINRLQGDQDQLWLNKYTKNPLTIDGLKQAIRAAFGRAGMKAGPHALRHTFGTSWIRNGGNQFALQEILGHSNIQTTRIYVEMNQSDSLRDQHRLHSPIARRLQALPDAQASSDASGLGRARGLA